MINLQLHFLYRDLGKHSIEWEMLYIEYFHFMQSNRECTEALKNIY